MYKAINEYIICQIPERKTESGIILAKQDQGQTFELLVVGTTDLTKELKDKYIYVEHRHVKARLLPDTHHTVIKLEEVIAVKE